MLEACKEKQHIQICMQDYVFTYVPFPVFQLTNRGQLMAPDITHICKIRHIKYTQVCGRNLTKSIKMFQEYEYFCMILSFKPKTSRSSW